MKTDRREYQRKWREAHKSEQNEYKRLWYIRNKVAHQLKGKQWREKNKEHKRVKDQEYYRNNKEKWSTYAKDNADRINESNRIRRAKNPEKYNQRSRAYRQRNSARHVDEVRRWKQRNPEKALAAQRKRRSTLTGRLRHNLSSRIRMALRNGKAGIKTISILGCSLSDFLIYLESKFEVGMTWENYGKVWHVDHIMPCAIFDLTKPEHQKRCFHFSNLQPLFGRDNLRKGAKITTNQYNLL